MAKKLTTQQFKQLDGLFDDTIVPALGEDFTFKTEEHAQLAIDYLIQRLENLSPEVVVFEE